MPPHIARSVMSRESLGFTIIELMVALALVVIIITIGMPSFTQMVANQRLTSQANDLVGDVLFARSEAASRGARVTLCTSTNGTSCSGTAADWNRGRIVFVDLDADGTLDAGEPIIKVTQISGTSTIAVAGFPNNDWIAFGAYGGMTPSGTSGTFTLCVTSSNTGRQVAINLMGRPVVTRVACP
jgi:type IV fimbrial biogenesis protein FimT